MTTNRTGLRTRTQDLRDDLQPLTATLCGLRDLAADRQRPELAAWLAEAASLVGADRLRRRTEIDDLERAAGRTTTWWSDAGGA